MSQHLGPSIKNRHPKADVEIFCGARGIRTPDLFHAMEARYQLRHSPFIEFVAMAT